MNQPPEFSSNTSDQPKPQSSRTASPLPQWRRPKGVAAGTWDYFNDRAIADRYDAFVADTPLCRLDEAVLGELFPGPDLHAQELILDLGCGSGRSALPLASRGYTVVAIDLSQAMLQVLAGKPVAGLGGVLPLRANLVQLECLADDSADHAICLFSTLGMIQGREHRQQMLRHIQRIVRRGGHFLMHVHHRWAAIREYRGLRTLAASWWRSRRSPGHDFGDTTYAYRGLEQMFMHRFSKRELHSDLIEAGWHIDTVWPLAIDGSRIATRFTIPGGYLVHAVA